MLKIKLTKIKMKNKINKVPLFSKKPVFRKKRQASQIFFSDKNYYDIILIKINKNKRNDKNDNLVRGNKNVSSDKNSN